MECRSFIVGKVPLSMHTTCYPTLCAHLTARFVSSITSVHHQNFAERVRFQANKPARFLVNPSESPVLPVEPAGHPVRSFKSGFEPPPGLQGWLDRNQVRFPV
ncbi:hypothetical protein LOK49_LG09G02133 [Camellia lanceoleosa]|uniref:Uncharacterized protein n=1 Tax=Camellia lanceoleosa TaxID=1840588 RepID=A0ACC0GGV8_9ERIC|nr:hypothetical protein LOK49_LG09G02133 [Camellia lanceoleosa]